MRIRRRLEILLGGPALVLAIGIVTSLIVVCGLLIRIVESASNPHVDSLPSAFGWVFVALLGEAPGHPVTVTGKVTYYMIELLKPVSVGLIIAALTTKVVQFLLRKGRGEGRVRLKDHFVICGWSGKGPEIIQELRGRGDAESGRPIVILAQLADDPSKDPLTTFVRGDPTNADDLARAGIKDARAAILLADNSYPGMDVEEMDSRTLVTALAIESIAPQVYTCVEVIRSENLDHFARTRADEIVVSAKLTGALLAHSAATPGLSDVVGELLTFPRGNEFYWIPVPDRLVGQRFGDVLVDLKARFGCLPVAMRSEAEGIRTNPPGDAQLQAGDRLLVIAEEYPNL
jgi:voltage-gated potassium channel